MWCGYLWKEAVKVDSWPSCVVKVLYVKKEKENKPSKAGRHYKTSIFPPFVPSQNSGAVGYQIGW